jgi:hypothetical protein
LLGWIEVDTPVERIKEMKKGTLPTIRPSDKGATRKYEKAINRIPSGEIDKMTLEQITEKTMSIVTDIAKKRNGKSNPNGWSPLSRTLALRISLHGTAVKTKNSVDRIKIMKGRVEETRKRERRMDLSEDERGWLKDNGLENDPMDWERWTMQYRAPNAKA